MTVARGYCVWLQIEDLNDLLSKRQRDVRRMRAQIDSIARVPEQGMTLPQLAAKAALADCLQQQLHSAVARNEALQRGARASDTKGGFNVRARRRLQTLATAFGVRRSAHCHQRAHCVSWA